MNGEGGSLFAIQIRCSAAYAPSITGSRADMRYRRQHRCGGLSLSPRCERCGCSLVRGLPDLAVRLLLRSFIRGRYCLPPMNRQADLFSCNLQLFDEPACRRHCTCPTTGNLSASGDGQRLAILLAASSVSSLGSLGIGLRSGHERFRIIFPGFISPFGSSADLMARISSIPSPCSFSS